VDNAVKQTKAGRATAKGLLGFASGDASIGAAMKNGNISKVHHIDSESTSIFGIWSSYQTVVHGE